MKFQRITKTLALSALIVFTAGLSAFAQGDDAGTSAFSFMKIETTARAVALGGAFTGVADDEATLFYNPAGFGGFENKRFSFGYVNNVFDMQTGYVAYIHPLSYKADKAVAVYLNYMNYGDFIRTNSFGEEDGTFSGSSILFGVGYAMRMNEQLKFGGVVKLMLEKIEDYSAHGFAVDLGVKYSLKDERTNLGFAIQNLGAQLSGFTEDADTDPMPLRFRGGISHLPTGLPLLLALDVIYPTDNDLYFAFGGELISARPLFIRAGWNSFGSSNYETGGDNDWLAGFSAGIGVELDKFQISYAVSPQSDLGTSHRVTLNGGF